MRYIKEFLRFLKHIVNSRELLLTLIKNDFKKQYLGSYFGLIWAFIQPLTFIVIIWFVFERGFRTGSTTDGTPFFLWLISGMIPWFFIVNAIISGTNSITSNAFLVKKVTFRVSILPLVQISSALIIHLFLVAFLIIAFLFHGYMPSIYWLQLPFYIFCSILFLLASSLLTSSIKVFVKDVGNIVAVLTQVGFWATPIFWSIDMIPERYQWIIKLNPAFYVVDGYRNTFINHSWFFENLDYTIYYLVMTLISLVFGAIVFKRLRPHFGDVL